MRVYCAFFDGNPGPKFEELSAKELDEIARGEWAHTGRNGVTREAVQEQARIILSLKQKGLL